MTQVTLNNGSVDSAGSLKLRTNGTTEAVDISTGQVVTLAKDAVVNGLTLGRGAGAVSTNTAVGASALAANTSGYINTAVGYNCMNANTVGAENSAFGVSSLASNTTGNFNVALGRSALQSNTTASNNTAVGYQAGYSNTTGGQNTALGKGAAYSNTTGSYNTSVGTGALRVNTDGIGNTIVGCGAADLLTGSYNTIIGPFVAGVAGAGDVMTTGSKNTIIGRFNGNQGGLDIRTASNYIVLSDGDGNPRGWFNNLGNFLIGGDSASARVLPQTDNAGYVGEAARRWSAIYAVTGTIQTSDGNQKQDVELLTEAERLVAVAIKSLMRTYRFKDAVAEKGDAARIHVGAIAQDVKAAFEAHGLDAHRYAMFCSDTWVDETTNEEVTRLGLRYEELLAFVIAAL